MKIQGKDSVFKPVTITLETQEELDIFAEIFHRIGGVKFLKVFGNTSTVINGLLNQGALHPDDSPNEVTGSIRID